MKLTKALSRNKLDRLGDVILFANEAKNTDIATARLFNKVSGQKNESKWSSYFATMPKQLLALKLLLSIVFITFLIACDTKLEIEMPTPKPKLVLNSVFTPFTPPYNHNFKVQVWENSPILDTTKVSQITDAKVYWYADGELIDTLEYKDEFGGFTSNKHFYFPEKA